MKRFVLKTVILIYILLSGITAFSQSKKILTIKDESGVIVQTESPIALEIKLHKKLLTAAEERRLVLIDPECLDESESLIPVQMGCSPGRKNSQIVMIIPDSAPGLNKFKMIERISPSDTIIKASLDPNSGQVIIEENGKKVLQYNYKTVYEKDVIRHPEEKLEESLRTNKDSFLTTSIYAVPRSDYIHPLYGLEGEMLTRDWPVGGHPHHRGIFWAWPEVEIGTERGDIYALQKIFARPTGKIELTSGPVFAQIIAENLWMWKDAMPIVREIVVIRVYRATSSNRIIDLTIKLDALEDSITIATRDTDKYGGLNLRMQTPESQEIYYFTDTTGSEPLRTWSDFNGIFNGNEFTTGLMVLQHKDNPEYPGSWIEYPNLAWIQPTFPAKSTRFPLHTDKSLILRYRLIVHATGKPDKLISQKSWDAFNGTLSPLYTFKTTKN